MRDKEKCQIYNLKTKQIIATIDAYLMRAFFSPKGNFIIFVKSDGVYQLIKALNQENMIKKIIEEGTSQEKL